MDNNEIIKIQQKFPFLTGIRYKDEDFVGIIQNKSDKIISFYDIDTIASPEEKQEFIELGELWWYESNRKLPINIFLGQEMKPYRYCLKTFILKEVNVLFGPIVSLNDIVNRRTKRKQIQLVKKVDD